MPSGQRYWTVLDEDRLAPVAAADEFLRHVRFGRDQAESTTRTYAGAVALYLTWCGSTRQDWTTAAGRLGTFMFWLRHSPGDGTAAVARAGSEPVRGPRRINTVLAGVREFLAHGTTLGTVPAFVLSQLYEIADERDLPPQARGEGHGLRYVAKARHRASEPDEPVGRASDEEVLALLRACHSARDRFIVLLLARAGLRRSEAVGLRREDIHFVLDAGVLGCRISGSHLHVVRRDNDNGAWAKSKRTRAVPVDFLLVQAYDQYVTERATCQEARDSDFVLVNLFRPPLGAPMPPRALNDLFDRLSRRARLDEGVHPHALRHAFASNAADAGAVLDEIADLLGHASPSSSQVYLHPDPQRLRSAVERVGALAPRRNR
ncbi:recombinase XerD [Streptomyces venezuelae]|uniref:Recombinase XerD n=2 Tax=Streptomyces venezuelae TaxID=54571 RepID=A0A5P2DNX0_STRVZ|nr:tyrosine-type recombinase/integrase [Streptomyces venezuelae]QES56904.1 recombinase XerD [Streptomyces venezuelae]